VDQIGNKFVKFEKKFGHKNYDKDKYKGQSSKQNTTDKLSSEDDKTGQLTGQGEFIRNRQNSPCHLCGELGHWRYECPKADVQNVEQKSDETNGSNLN
jgi:hypothetical protein